MFEQITIQVSGMTCSGCEQRAVTVAQRLAGVRAASADHRDGIVTVEVDVAQTSRSQLADRLAQAGFTPVEARS